MRYVCVERSPSSGGSGLAPRTGSHRDGALKPRSGGAAAARLPPCSADGEQLSGEVALRGGLPYDRALWTQSVGVFAAGSRVHGLVVGAGVGRSCRAKVAPRKGQSSCTTKATARPQRRRKCRPAAALLVSRACAHKQLRHFSGMRRAMGWILGCWAGGGGKVYYAVDTGIQMEWRHLRIRHKTG